MTDISLRDLYNSHGGKVSDKWDLYLFEYERLLRLFRDRPVRLLEIGVQNGGSLEIWSKFFSSAESIVGCDIDKKCGDLLFEDSRIQVVIGDATSEETAFQIQEVSPDFDVVIDDGSHTSGDIIMVFCRYFQRLSEGGIYIIEDLHCSYWKEFDGGLFDPYSAISFFKGLADVVNKSHWGVKKERKDLFKGATAKYELDLSESMLRRVHSVEFLNSMCVIRKLPSKKNELGHRVIAGKDELVAQGHMDIPYDELLEVRPQTDNPWSDREKTPAEELEELIQETGHLREQVDKLVVKVEQSDLKKLEVMQLAEDRSGQYQRLLNAVKAGEPHDSPEGIIGQVVRAPARWMRQRKAFNSKYYLAAYPDVAKSGMDPFEHYLLYGRSEGRLPRPVSSMERLGNLFSGFGRFLNDEGGVVGASKTAWGVLRDEGLCGITFRVAAAADVEKYQGYAQWIDAFDRVNENDRASIKQRIEALNEKPLISILMPTYNSNLVWLKEAIDSCRTQLYENWELCIADDASTDKGLRPFLEQIAEKDPRIKVHFCIENGHISRSSNEALNICAGEWVALMDHDDLLPEHALFHVVNLINHRPSVQLIYSDEDKIDENGQRFDPYFKCDWNPDLFYSQNMISHLGVYRREVLEKIGGFRVGFEGSQDYDLVLRYIEQINQDEIRHIPKVLYHWRVHADSTAGGVEAKPYAVTAAERALQEHFDRRDTKAKVEGLSFGYRVHYALPEVLPQVSLIIPTRNSADLVRVCVDSIREKTTYQNYEILLVDNGSDDPEAIQYFSELNETENFQVVRDDRPFNFSQLNNFAVGHANGDLIGFVNNDIEVINGDWLSELVSFACQPGVGAVGAKLLYPDDTVQHAGVVLGIGGVGSHAFKGYPVNHAGYFGRASLISSFSALTAACMLIRKSVFEEIGGFEEENLAIAFNDVDLCLRIREAGYRNVFNPNALLYHHESISRGNEDTPEKLTRFNAEIAYMQRTWGEKLLCDPAYSPNLTLQAEDFGFAWPPRTEKICAGL